MKWGILSLGFLLLLSGAFLDNLRGPLLPVFVKVFNLTHSDSSLFLIVGSLGGIVATFMLIPLMLAFSERAVLGWLLTFAFSVAVSSFFVHHYLSLIIFGGAIGICVSTLGAMANIITLQATNLENRGKAFMLLHTMYGIGSFLAPNVVSATIGLRLGWHTPFVVLGVAILVGLLLARQVLPKKSSRESNIPERALLNRFQIFTIGLFSTYVAGEVLVSMWMVTYLVEVGFQTISEASILLGYFFLIMMATRIVSFFFLKERNEKKLLFFSLLFSIGFLSLGLSGKYWALPLVGALGPFFPLLLSRVTLLFGTQGRSMTLWIIGTNAAFIVVSHRLVGVLSDRFGLAIAYWVPLFLLVLALLGFVLFLRFEKKYQPL